MLEVKIKKLHKDAVIPKYETTGSVGMDITATSKTYDDHGNIVYGTGLALEIPEGYYADLRPRSSISKYNLMLTNSVGTIDADYRGEIMFKFKRIGEPYIENEQSPTNWLEVYKEYDIGDRIGQIVILPYPKIKFVEVDTLSETLRGDGGFGSTGAGKEKTSFEAICEIITLIEGEDVAESFAKQTIEYYGDTRTPMEYELVTDVSGSFIWIDSKEGHDFWYEVANRVRELKKQWGV